MFECVYVQVLGTGNTASVCPLKIFMQLISLQNVFCISFFSPLSLYLMRLCCQVGVDVFFFSLFFECFLKLRCAELSGPTQ